MPAARGPDLSRIEDALAALNGALSEVGVPWMVIGGIAVIAHGVQRMTTDIDVVIQGDAISIVRLIRVLRRHQIVARINDAEAFAATNLVLLTRHRPTEVDLDLSFGWTAFEHQALAACVSRRYGRVAAPMAGVEDLIVFKAMASRPRDIDDAVTLLTLYPHVDLARVRARVVALAELAEAPELTRGLEEIVRVAGPTSPPARGPSSKKPSARLPTTRTAPKVAKAPRPVRPPRRSEPTKKRKPTR